MANCTNCSICNHFIKSSAMAVTGTSPNQVLTITIPPTTFTNLDEYCLALCQDIPSNAGTLPIKIANGTTTYNVMCRKGNTLRADQVRSRRRYKITYGNDSAHIMFLSSVCPTAYVVTPSVPTPTVVTPPVVSDKHDKE